MKKEGAAWWCWSRKNVLFFHLSSVANISFRCYNNVSPHKEPPQTHRLPSLLCSVSPSGAEESDGLSLVTWLENIQFTEKSPLTLRHVSSASNAGVRLIYAPARNEVFFCKQMPAYQEKKGTKPYREDFKIALKKAYKRIRKGSTFVYFFILKKKWQS